jgi:hypothetical protein
MNAIPLCVDLDGTLIYGDTLIETMRVVMKRRQHLLLAIPFWLLGGRPNLKRQLSARVTPDYAELPYNQAVLDYLREQRNTGRPLILVTGADAHIGRGVADHLGGMFEEVIGSDGKTNLTGRNKAAYLVTRFGQRGFDYAGNERRDLAIWAVARRAIVVSRNEELARQAAQLCEVEKSFIVPASEVRFVPWS